MKNIKHKIKCPYCGYEYFPSEIFIPKYFFGVQENIERSSNGEILDYNGEDMCLEEQYICDKCNKQFSIKPNISFETTKQDDKYDFDKDFISKNTSKKYSLFEN